MKAIFVLQNKLDAHAALNAAPPEDENLAAHIFMTEMNSCGLD
ncbi:hypothetical protein B4098_0018 [Heyndrickxia coagulans]|uniref:Uncharacterized protein n=1 Tax=Heyndrickxia coagulans TaxID=1398 RepID=A0A150JS97_HEYCO|nr:hypothetical protein B4098_0018 [Heyndrickxia coagulans]